MVNLFGSFTIVFKILSLYFPIQRLNYKMKYLFFSSFTILLLVSCSKKETQNLEELDKKSAREVTLTTVKKGDSVLHISKQNIWYNGERIAQKTDTIITANKVSSWGNEQDSVPMSEIPIFVTVQ